jgi:hypothetical protein
MDSFQMKLLTTAEIEDLDLKLDAPIPSMPLLARERDVALIHLLRAYESYMVGNATTANRGERENATKHAYEGLHHGVKWIMQYCPQTSSAAPLTFDAEVYLEAEQLHKEAREYSKVWDLMSMLHRGLIEASKENDETIHLKFASELNKEMDFAGTILNDPYGPELSEPILTPDVIHDIATSVTVQSVDPLSYQVSDDLFSRMFDRISRMTSDKWEMDPNWNLGGYTLAQLRTLANTLDTICTIHGEVSRRLDNPQTILAAIIKYHPKNTWMRILARRSRLSQEVVAAILSDLTYDGTLYAAGSKQPHITYQPIFPLATKILAVSNWLVHVSNMERNLWDLTSIKRPELHSRLRNLKEKSWIQELRQRAPELGLNIYPTIKFEFEGQKSDLDALIIDKNCRFGLICQLKWLIQPGRISGVIYNDREIEKGIEQAELALKWARSNPTGLAQRIDLRAADLTQYEFAPIVLCKSTLASGYLRRPGVPVINERLFDWILSEPFHKDIRTLWNVGEELSYLPEQGKHFETINASVEFAGVTFRLDGLACLPKSPWKADVDLRIPS